MKNNHHRFILFFLLAMPFSMHSMETPPSPVTSLYTLCTQKIITGYGDTYVEQRKNALASVEEISVYDFVTNFKRSLVHHHFCSLPCVTKPLTEQSPSILMNANNKLYGIVGKNMYIWDLSTKNGAIISEKKVTKLHRGQHRRAQVIQCAMIKKDAPFLYTCANNGGVKMWNIESNRCTYVDTLTGSFWNKITDLSETDNGDLCATDIHGKIKIWDIETQSHKETLYNTYPKITILKVLADTDTVYAGGRDNWFMHTGPILIYDRRVEQHVGYVASHDSYIKHLAKSKKDTQFYSSSCENIIRIWDKRAMKESVHTLKTTDYVRCVEENKDGTLLIACTDDGVYTWDLTTGKPYIINKMTPEPTRCMTQDENSPCVFIGTKTGIKTITPDCTYDTARNIINKW